MKLLLTGATGGIGQRLLPYFKDYEVTAVNSKTFPLPIVRLYDTDIVIHLAGVSLLNDLSKHSLLNKKLIEVNCLGTVNLLATYLPAMRQKKFGRIILMSSVCSEMNLPLHGLYSASKAFNDKLVKIAALENAEYGITVNSIQLGYTGVGMSENSSDLMIKQRNKSALKRFCKIEEIYQTIDYLINCEYITGQNIRLDGGIR